MRAASVALTLVAGTFLAPPAGAAEPRVQMELGPDPIGLGESAQLAIEVSVDGSRGVDLEPQFRLDNFEVAGGPSIAHGTSWVNGRTSSSASSVWWLRPLVRGRAAVRDVRLRVGEQILTLPDREIEVVEAAPRRRATGPRRGFDPMDPFGGLFPDDPMAPFRRTAPAAAQPKIRLRAELDHSTAWVGEQVVWRLVLDTQADISAFRPRTLPEFQGFWVREIALPERLRPEWVEAEGERFGRMTMQQRALFPMRAGRQRFEPVQAEVLARVAEAGWFAPLARDHPLQLATEPIELEVRALPPGAAAVVGEIEVGSRLERDRIEAGQAATWVVTAAGLGNLRGIEPPTPPLPPGLRLFPPGRRAPRRSSAGASAPSSPGATSWSPTGRAATRSPPFGSAGSTRPGRATGSPARRR